MSEDILTPGERKSQQREEFRQVLTRTLELGIALKGMQEAVEGMRSWVRLRGFKLEPMKLVIPDGADLIDDDDMVHEGVKEFVFDRIWSVSEHGIEFSNWQTKAHVTINHTDFYLEPVEPAEPAP